MRGAGLPDLILTSEVINDKVWLRETLKDHFNKAVVISEHARGLRSKWIELAKSNAQQALAARLASKANLQQRFAALQEALGLDNLPQRIECFDISHSHGEKTVASCVVFGEDGAMKSDYRRFNIQDITPGDDYAAMKQALLRRYTRVQEHSENMPDIILIDGGKGQLRQGIEALEELQLIGVTLVGVAKGPERKAGLEQLYVAGQEGALQLAEHHLGLHLIQQIRDEAHRFAITGHRQRRDKMRRVSRLEEIPGIGPKRRRALLKHFGGLQNLKNASVNDISEVSGISRQLALQIYEVLR